MRDCGASNRCCGTTGSERWTVGVGASKRGALSPRGLGETPCGADESARGEVMRGEAPRDASVSNDKGRELRADGNVGRSDMRDDGLELRPESPRVPSKGVGDPPGAMRAPPRTGVFSGIDWKRDAPPGAGEPGSMSRIEPRPELVPRGMVAVGWPRRARSFPDPPFMSILSGVVPRRLRDSPRTDVLPSPPMEGALLRASGFDTALSAFRPPRICARPGAVSGCRAERLSRRTLRIEEPLPPVERSIRPPVCSTGAKCSRPMRASSA